jgi:hypothetical protein
VAIVAGAAGGLASSWTALGKRAAQVREILTEAHDTRGQWEVMTGPTRRMARAADVELKRRGVFGHEDTLRSAEPEGFKYPGRGKTAEVWVQPRLDGGIDLPREPELEPLACGCRKCRHPIRPVNTRGGVGPRQQGQPSAQPDEDQIEQTK